MIYALLGALALGFVLFVRSMPEPRPTHVEPCLRCGAVQTVRDGWRIAKPPCDDYGVCHACGRLVWFEELDR